MLLSPEGQRGKAWETSKKGRLFCKWGALDRKVLPLLYRISKALQLHRTEILHPPDIPGQLPSSGMRGHGHRCRVSVLIARQSAPQSVSNMNIPVF
jgi:hypothetical protein